MKLNGRSNWLFLTVSAIAKGALLFSQAALAQHGHDFPEATFTFNAGSLEGPEEVSAG